MLDPGLTARVAGGLARFGASVPSSPAMARTVLRRVQRIAALHPTPAAATLCAELALWVADFEEGEFSVTL